MHPHTTARAKGTAAVASARAKSGRSPARNLRHGPESALKAAVNAALEAQLAPPERRRVQNVVLRHERNPGHDQGGSGAVEVRLPLCQPDRVARAHFRTHVVRPRRF